MFFKILTNIIVLFSFSTQIYAAPLEYYIELYNRYLLESCFGDKYEVVLTSPTDFEEVKSFISSPNENFAYSIRHEPQEWTTLDNNKFKSIKNVEKLNLALKSKVNNKLYSVLGLDKKDAETFGVLPSHFLITRTLTDPHERGKRFNNLLRIFSIIIAQKSGVDWIVSQPIEGASSIKINKAFDFQETPGIRPSYYLDAKNVKLEYFINHLSSFCDLDFYTKPADKSRCLRCIQTGTKKILEIANDE